MSSPSGGGLALVVGCVFVISFWQVVHASHEPTVRNTFQGMHIDSTKLMYHTFQRCRLAQPDTGDCLSVLATTLDGLQPEARAIVSLLPPIEPLLPGDVAAAVRVWWFHALVQPVLPTTAQPFLALARSATTDLQQLWRRQHLQPVRALGYALHNLPLFVRTPTRFDPDGYLHSFRIAGAYWAEFSPALKAHFCVVLNRSLGEVQQLLAAQEAPR